MAQNEGKTRPKTLREWAAANKSAAAECTLEREDIMSEEGLKHAAETFKKYGVLVVNDVGDEDAKRAALSKLGLTIEATFKSIDDTTGTLRNGNIDLIDTARTSDKFGLISSGMILAQPPPEYTKFVTADGERVNLDVTFHAANIALMIHKGSKPIVNLFRAIVGNEGFVMSQDTVKHSSGKHSSKRTAVKPTEFHIDVFPKSIERVQAALCFEGADSTYASKYRYLPLGLFVGTDSDEFIRLLADRLPAFNKVGFARIPQEICEELRDVLVCCKPKSSALLLWRSGVVHGEVHLSGNTGEPICDAKMTLPPADDRLIRRTRFYCGFHRWSNTGMSKKTLQQLACLAMDYNLGLACFWTPNKECAPIAHMNTVCFKTSMYKVRRAMDTTTNTPAVIGINDAELEHFVKRVENEPDLCFILGIDAAKRTEEKRASPTQESASKRRAVQSVASNTHEDEDDSFGLLE